MNKYDNILETDVLVIGGGFSGTWAAIKAREHVRNVLMVDKGPRDWGGLGSMSGGDMIVMQPDTMPRPRQSRGPLSTTSTLRPCWAARIAAHMPEKPPPMIRTSAVCTMGLGMASILPCCFRWCRADAP